MSATVEYLLATNFKPLLMFHNLIDWSTAPIRTWFLLTCVIVVIVEEAADASNDLRSS